MARILLWLILSKRFREVSRMSIKSDEKGEVVGSSHQHVLLYRNSV